VDDAQVDDAQVDAGEAGTTGSQASPKLEERACRTDETGYISGDFVLPGCVEIVNNAGVPGRAWCCAGSKHFAL